MKTKSLLLLAPALLCAAQAYGWGREGHEAVAYIAECNLTPKAKATVEGILDGHSIVYYASWMDEYRRTPEYKHTSVWHRAYVDKDMRYTDAIKRPEGEAIAALEESISMLKNYKQLDDSTAAVRVKYIIHLLGDMHCPVHVIYPDIKRGFNVMFEGDTITHHKLWDAGMIRKRRMWHYMEWQHQLDRCTPEQKAAITAGTPRDWIHQTATDSRYLYDIAGPGTKIGRDYMNANIGLVDKQILKAGYRLAHVLNGLFN